MRKKERINILVLSLKFRFFFKFRRCWAAGRVEGRARRGDITEARHWRFHSVGNDALKL